MLLSFHLHNDTYSEIYKHGKYSLTLFHCNIFGMTQQNITVNNKLSMSTKSYMVYTVCDTSIIAELTCYISIDRVLLKIEPLSIN